MSISSTLKTNSFLPASISIEPFYFLERFHYNIDPNTEHHITDQTSLYDKEFALIKRIEIWTKSDSALNTLMVETGIEDPREIQYTSKRKVEGTMCFIWDLSLVANRVSLPQSGLLSNIVSFKITGKNLAELQETYDTLEKSSKELDQEWTKKVNEIHNSKKIVAQSNEELKSSKEALEEISTKAIELKRAIDERHFLVNELTAKKEQLNSDISSLLNDMKSQKDQVVELKETTEEIITKKTTLNDQLETVKQELHKHQIASYRYSEDFDTFKREIMFQNFIFATFLVAFIGVGAYIASSLVNGSYEVLRAFNSGVNIYELMISRVPTVLIHSMIIYFLGKWITFIMQGVMSNLGDLKKLKQLVYLVKEVTETQAIGLDESEDPHARYKQRVSEKMAIVRDALCIVPSSETKPSTNEKKASMAARFVSETAKTTLGQ